MNTKQMSREQISALADGEVADAQLDAALAALRKEDARADWAIYHQIGDVLRSDDMAVNMSTNFSARFAARLDAEPTIIAPAALESASTVDADTKEDRTEPNNVGQANKVRRWAVPGMVAAAAMATAAFVATPQLMVALKGTPTLVQTGTAMASADTGPSGSSGNASVVAASASGEVIVRDARIDDYLLAHQRFSPSLYSTAQYARSATFATDSSK